jgi:hypothetical protein
MKLLIAAGEVPERADVPAGIALLIEGASDVLVMSPSIVGRLDWLTGEVDKARHLADERVAAILSRLDAAGIHAAGARGDEDIYGAFADAVVQFSPDHIVIALQRWTLHGRQRQELMDKLLERFRLPITIFAID